jgi:hypothetical protein
MLKCYIRLKILHMDGRVDYKDKELLVPINDESGVKTAVIGRYLPIIAQEYPNCLINEVFYTKKCEIINKKKGFEDKKLEEMTSEELQDYIVANDVYEAPLYNQRDIMDMPTLIREAERRKIKKLEDDKKASQENRMKAMVEAMDKKHTEEKEESKRQIDELTKERNEDRKQIAELMKMVKTLMPNDNTPKNNGGKQTKATQTEPVDSGLPVPENIIE